MGILGHSLLTIAVVPGWAVQVFFTASSRGSEVHSLDMASTPPQHKALLKYEFGPQNPGGGATGICAMDNFLYWADQTTGTLHRARLDGGDAVDHDPKFIDGLNDPQGVCCDIDSGRVYVIDNEGGFGSTGTPTILYRESDAGTTKMNITNADKISSLRGVTSVKGVLWAAGDGGIFRAKPANNEGTAFEFETVVTGAIYEAISIDTESKNPRIFATTYSWDGTGVLSTALDPSLRSFESPLWPVAGSSCQRGSEILWSTAVDPSTKQLFWVKTDDHDPNNMAIMVENYASYKPGQKAQVAFSGKGLSGYGIALHQTAAQTLLV